MRPGLQHGLGRGLNGLFLFIRGVLRPGEVVVDDAIGIPITAFQPPAGIRTQAICLIALAPMIMV